jgi:preprotein translocase subunit SecF
MFDFARHRALFYLVSAAVIVPGLLSILLPGGLRPGIDFTGGAVLTLEFSQPVTEEALQNTFSRVGHAEAVVQRASGTNDFVVRTRPLAQPAVTADGSESVSGRQQIEGALTQDFGSVQVLSLDQVSPLIAADIVRNAVLAVAAASAIILLYLWWAFRAVPEPWSYGTAAIAGLLHDAFAVLGLFSILGRLFDLELQSTFIVAILTVIGFSVRDSIVVFDRVRENLVRRSGEPFGDILNHSIMQTLTRSLNTSLTVILTLLVVFLFGGTSVRPFVLAILLGIIVGGYSSIFFSGMLLLSWRSGELRRLLFFVPQRKIVAVGAWTSALSAAPVLANPTTWRSVALK